MESQDRPGAREAQEDSPRVPNTDMQPEDAGTPESGKETADPGRGTAAEPALKQTGKTDAETGSRG